MQEIDVQLLDAQGNSLYPVTRGGGGSSGTVIWHNYAVVDRPAVEFTIWDATYGRVTALDAVTPYMTIAEPVNSVGCVRFFIAPSVSTVVGYMYLVPMVDGLQFADGIQVPVGGSTLSITWFPESLITGNLSFYRNTESALDTLKEDGVQITGLITNIELEIVRE